MPSVAMCLSCILSCWGFASKDVDFVGNRLNVCWIDTCAIAAEVIELKSVRNGPNKGFVCKTMCHSYYFEADTKVSISFWGSASCPYPASSQLRAMSRKRAVLVNLLPEPILNGSSHKSAMQRITMPYPFQIMRITHFSSHDRLATDFTSRIFHLSNVVNSNTTDNPITTDKL